MSKIQRNAGGLPAGNYLEGDCGAKSETARAVDRTVVEQQLEIAVRLRDLVVSSKEGDALILATARGHCDTPELVRWEEREVDRSRWILVAAAVILGVATTVFFRFGPVAALVVAVPTCVFAGFHVLPVLRKRIGWIRRDESVNRVHARSDICALFLDRVEFLARQSNIPSVVRIQATDDVRRVDRDVLVMARDGTCRMHLHSPVVLDSDFRLVDLDAWDEIRGRMTSA